MFIKMLILIAVTAAPVFELRGSIPLGLLGYNDVCSTWSVITVCIIANIAITPAVYYIFYGLLQLMRRWKRFDSFYGKYSEKVITNLKPKIEKYGVWGLALFIGIPLPGSGVYSGAIGAHALGMDFKKYFLASFIGVLIAGAAVSAIVISGSEVFDFFINRKLV